MQLKIKLLQYFVLLAFGVTGYSQSLFKEEKNYIQNTKALEKFYEKLDTKQPIKILHIGDSHIQANFLTGRLRELFQKKYGAADRGITFPLRLAKTNGHLDIKYYSDIEWKSEKIIDSKNQNVGISGVSIRTNSPSFFIKMVNVDTLNISQIKIIGNGLDSLKIGIPKKKIRLTTPTHHTKTYRVQKGDYLGKIARKFKVSVSKLKKWNHLKSDFLRIKQKLIIRKQTSNAPQHINLNDFELLAPTFQSDNELTFPVNSTNFKELYIISQKRKNNTSVTKIDGILLENYQSGVTYNSVGFNGAKYVDYNSSKLFFKQLPYLNELDLIILSLGTNEAFDKHYKTDNFYADVEKFILKIKEITQCDAILVTTTPSSLIKRRKTNPKLNTFSEILKKVAKQNNVAVWDLFEIMGKENGIKNWAKKGLAGRDRIHYKKDGYFLQAELLFNALEKK